jgi:hypothetical protein
MGNPPYVGGKTQTLEQKQDMQSAFNAEKKIGELDYIASWFIKAAFYLNESSRFAFVTTNSVCQGSQVQQLWPQIFRLDEEIFFAYKPFKWSNNAKENAAVTCTIVGVRKTVQLAKYIINENHKKLVKNIRPYLIEGDNTIVYQSLKSISNLPSIITGNSPYDGGHLLLTRKDKDELLHLNIDAMQFIKKLQGSSEYINGDERWCLWIEDKDLNQVSKIEFIVDRIKQTKEFRINGGDVARGLADRPHQFRYRYTAQNNLIIVPRVSSERRKYIPFGFLNSDNIVSDSAQVIYDPETYIFSVLMSNMHMVWIRTTCGSLESRIRYSSALGYNTFPFPHISDSQKHELETHVYRILDEREKHSERTPAQWYDPDKMPEGLREAHRLNDLAVERCYRSRPFESDEERLEYLFKLYEQMIEEEKNRGTLFAGETKIKKKTKTK